MSGSDDMKDETMRERSSRSAALDAVLAWSGTYLDALREESEEWLTEQTGFTSKEVHAVFSEMALLMEECATEEQKEDNADSRRAGICGECGTELKGV